MTLLFPKWTNKVPAMLALGAAAAGLSVVFIVYFWFSPKNTDVGYQPYQPIPYSHKLHAGTLGMDCRYCHRTVEESYSASIPDADTCYGCHKHVKTDSEQLEPLRAAFDVRHEETFGYADRGNDAEIVNLRLVSIGAVPKPDLVFDGGEGARAKAGTRKVWFGGWCETQVYDRALMAAGFAFTGPAIVEEAGGTTVVPPGWSVNVHPSGALACEHVAAPAEGRD